MRPIARAALFLSLLPLALAAPPALADTGPDSTGPASTRTASITHPARLAGSAVARALAGAQAHHSTDAKGVAVADLPQLHSADRKFMSGAYSVAGPNQETFTGEGYPVNEFMVFLEGGVTLTSADGTVLAVRAGDSVSIPKGWLGTWSSPGYRKFYVIYDPNNPVE